MKKYVVYVLKRLLAMIPILLIVSFGIFFLLRISGSSEMATIIGDKPATDELKERIINEYGLDDPLFLRYVNWLKGVVSGDFGRDYSSGQAVSELIVTRVPVTLGLVGISFVLGTVMAILLGVIASLHRNKPVDTVISLVMLFFSSVPAFLICVVVLILVAKFVPGYSFVGTYTNTREFFQRIMLPAFIMSLGHLALLGRVTRSSMTSQLQSPYIITALAKGIEPKEVTFKHAFHNAVIPVLTVAGNSLAGAIGSTVLIEQIFSLPGIGGLLISGVQTNNYPVVQILVMLMLIIYLLVSLLVDVLYVIVDPRVSLT
ncbi:MAG: ABC transporter permease [Butyrivibrio sp.]|nr:ABC transporter permease [Butyrivibrio sp.]